MKTYSWKMYFNVHHFNFLCVIYMDNLRTVEWRLSCNLPHHPGFSLTDKIRNIGIRGFPHKTKTNSNKMLPQVGIEPRTSA